MGFNECTIILLLVRVFTGSIRFNRSVENLTVENSTGNR